MNQVFNLAAGAVSSSVGIYPTNLYSAGIFLTERRYIMETEKKNIHVKMHF